MWYNHVNSIPKAIKKFKKIEDIIMDHNELSKIPGQISSLKTLKKLILAHNQLDAEAIKPIFKLNNLEKLELNENKIVYLSSEVKNLRNLKYLDISSNPLKKLPDEFSQLNNLEQLGLGELNNFDWTETFLLLEKLPQLRRVGMYRNGLKTMPDGFEKLKQVNLFWLNQNLFDAQEKKRIASLLPGAKLEFN
jgi:Leucine-rich repeat (LRR) protein